jgi:bifunctional DNA-binding transcriptional regulator/antitoxin component of YhaV-PrlF toxin-antitoxin module
VSQQQTVQRTTFATAAVCRFLVRDEALGLAPGDRLHLHVSGQRLVLERQQDAAAELRGLVASVPHSRSLVEELLAERRMAAACE